MEQKRKSLNLWPSLLSLGNVAPLDLRLNDDDPEKVKESVFAYKEHFKPYNPKKSGYNRYGLSLTSKDGGFSGVPDLDSLVEYNRLNKTNWGEPDFREPTPLFKACEPLKKTLKPFTDYMGRSHILKLNKGGFFPPHRDLSFVSFRLFISLVSINDYVFILDEKKLALENYRVYFINTFLSHSLFSFKDESLFVIFNIDLTLDSLRAVFRHLLVK